MDEVSTIVTEIGAMADETLDMFVKQQAGTPLNFKDLTEVMLAEREGSTASEFFLASIAATAIIRLAATQESES